MIVAFSEAERSGASDMMLNSEDVIMGLGLLAVYSLGYIQFLLQLAPYFGGTTKTIPRPSLEFLTA